MIKNKWKKKQPYFGDIYFYTFSFDLCLDQILDTAKWVQPTSFAIWMSLLTCLFISTNSSLARAMSAFINQQQQDVTQGQFIMREAYTCTDEPRTKTVQFLQPLLLVSISSNPPSLVQWWSATAGLELGIWATLWLFPQDQKKSSVKIWQKTSLMWDFHTHIYEWRTKFPTPYNCYCWHPYPLIILLCCNEEGAAVGWYPLNQTYLNLGTRTIHATLWSQF